jgi:protein-disulfide isomerase
MIRRTPTRRSARLPALLAVAALLAAALLAGAARAQAIGDDVATFLDAAGAIPHEDGLAGHLVGGLDVRTGTAGELLTDVTLEGALNDQGIADAASTLAIATGYGAGIEEPIARFLRERLGEMAGQGPVRVGVEAYTLELDVQAGEGETPLSGRLTLSLPRVEEATFGPPVATVGPEDADVVIRGFSDFQCPACRRYALEILPALEEGLLAGGEVRFAFHHLPLTSIHANAVPAAEAAQCAADRLGPDVFWPYHDLIFERQRAWSSLGDPQGYFVRLVRDLDAELLAAALGPAEDDATPSDRAEAALRACLEDGEARAAVQAAIDRAMALRLSSTPTVFVGGYRLNRFGSPDAYARLVRLHLAVTGQADAGSEADAEANARADD